MMKPSRFPSWGRFSGHSNSSIAPLNEFIRCSTDGSSSNVPIRLLMRKGALAHSLTSDGTRVNPTPPPGILYCQRCPVNGSCTVMAPTEGSSLYVEDEKLSQMLLRIALVPSGLHALVRRSVTGMRASVDR